MNMQLKVFKDKLRKQGFEVSTNWVIDAPNSKIIHCNLQKEKKILPVMFQMYNGNDAGFDFYLMSENISINDDLKMLYQMFKK